MRSVASVLAIALFTGAALAQESGRPRVRDIRSLMVEAIDSPSGGAQGILDGEAAQAIGRRFGATSPILVEVGTERRYRQPGCSRLKVAVRQDGVLLPGALARQDRSVEFGIDYCRDGSAPASLE